MKPEEILQEQIRNSPQEIKNFLQRKDWLFLVEEISEKNNLSSDQRTSLENEILFVILAMEPVTDFKENIQSSVELDESKASLISILVTEKIFRRIEKYLPKGVESEEGTKKESSAVQNINQDSITPPEIAPEIHPTTVAGETAHETEPNNKQEVEETETQHPADTPIQAKPLEQESTTPQRTQGYPDGKDPYREPLQ